MPVCVTALEALELKADVVTGKLEPNFYCFNSV